MRKQASFGAAAVIGLSLLAGSTRFQQTVHASPEGDAWAAPIVFQAAGPSVASIQSMVDAFRAAIGGANNGNAPNSIPEGRREINWDGGGSTATSPAPTPFDGFLVTRGARFTTLGSGFVQAPVEGLATTFGNPSYATIFRPFSPVRLFSPVDSNVTDARFFVPGGGELPATTQAFGAIFTDVDQQGHNRGRGRESATTMVFYGVDGKPLYRAVVPASAGDASLSFLGVLFDKAHVAHVRIKTGNVKPGADDGGRYDVVMMDDFIYGEPQVIEKVYELKEADAEEATSEDR
jgi:hypothetical protein